MLRNKIARKILYPTAAAAVILGGAVAPANALLSDNVHNTGTGGMTNCNGGDVCVKKVGDELEVSYEVQFGNMLKSSDHSQAVKGSMIAFPSVLKDVQLEVVATGKDGNGFGPQLAEMSGYPTHKFDTPVKVPVHTPEDLDEKNVPWDGGEISFILPDGSDENKDSSYVKKYSPDNKKEDRFFATHIKGEKIIEDFKKKGDSGDVVKDLGTEGVSKDSIAYDKSLGKAGGMSVDSPYDYLIFNNDNMGVQTFRITGKVKTESDLAFLPIRAKQGFYRCGQEGTGFGITDTTPWKEEFWFYKDRDSRGERITKEHNSCDNLLENYEWTRSDDTLPHYSLKNDEVTKKNIENNTQHGLSGSQKCAVTKDAGRYDLIEQDIKPRKLVEDGYVFRNGKNNNGSFSSTSWGSTYMREFDLHANIAITSILSGYNVAEDGCDQAGVEISLCTDDNPETTPSTPEETPTTSPKESTTPGETPTGSSDQTTPQTSEETSDSTTRKTTSKTSEGEDTPSTTPSTPEDEDTPSTTPSTSVRDEDDKEPEDETPVENTTPQNPGNNTIIPGGSGNVHTPSGGISTPRIPFIPQSLSYAGGHAQSPAAVASDNSGSGEEEVTEGPQVHTGGEVEKDTIFDKIVKFFTK